jgi:branched-chain amino acid transport system ATP-binding protein
MSDQSRTEARGTTVELRGVSAGYGHTTVLRGIDLTFPASSVTAILGPNGAGKTTLLKTISGALPASAGTVSMDGQNVTKLKPHQRVARGVCHIPEGRGVFRSLTVRENLELQSVPHAEKSSIDEAVSVFPVLGKKLNQTVRTMSGGEQQMLAMARAYVRNPALILVDEASLGLAPRIVDSIFEFLSRLAAGGATLVVVDQFVTRALSIADQVHILAHGELSFSGTADDLRGRDVFRDYVSGALGEDPAAAGTSSLSGAATQH